jgi:hypothetical protein
MMLLPRTKSMNPPRRPDSIASWSKMRTFMKTLTG